jgi:hypothetical protein
VTLVGVAITVERDISWGRAADRGGPTTGNFRARSPELGHFVLSFDGAGEYAIVRPPGR